MNRKPMFRRKTAISYKTEKKTVNHEEQLEEKQKALENLTRVKELPGIDDLRDHRSLRDKGWRSVRGAGHWNDSRPSIA